mmetsp:Transcript_6656/g.18567  ORF Transcript_6656/g.18567 Transcript_6656/m.18567 type:complete len:201 (-) Transcript_6656:992-1594(-)
MTGRSLPRKCGDRLLRTLSCWQRPPLHLGWGLLTSSSRGQTGEGDGCQPPTTLRAPHSIRAPAPSSRSHPSSQQGRCQAKTVRPAPLAARLSQRWGREARQGQWQAWQCHPLQQQLHSATLLWVPGLQPACFGRDWEMYQCLSGSLRGPVCQRQTSPSTPPAADTGTLLVLAQIRWCWSFCLQGETWGLSCGGRRFCQLL